MDFRSRDIIWDFLGTAFFFSFLFFCVTFEGINYNINQAIIPYF